MAMLNAKYFIIQFQQLGRPPKCVFGRGIPDARKYLAMPRESKVSRIPADIDRALE
jgi:hypothetical protein